MKEKIHGLVAGSKRYAFTEDFLKKKGNVWVEEISTGRFVTVKYFPDYDFVDMFEGRVPGVDEKGYVDGVKIARVAHRNSMIWGPWQHFYQDTILRI